MLLENFLGSVAAEKDNASGEVKHIRFATGPDLVLDVLSIYADDSGTIWVDLADQEEFESEDV